MTTGITKKTLRVGMRWLGVGFALFSLSFLLSSFFATSKARANQINITGSLSVGDTCEVALLTAGRTPIGPGPTADRNISITIPGAHFESGYIPGYQQTIEMQFSCGVNATEATAYIRFGSVADRSPINNDYFVLADNSDSNKDALALVLESDMATNDGTFASVVPDATLKTQVIVNATTNVIETKEIHMSLYGGASAPTSALNLNSTIPLTVTWSVS